MKLSSTNGSIVAFPLQQWLRKRALRSLIYIAYLVFFLMYYEIISYYQKRNKSNDAN